MTHVDRTVVEISKSALLHNIDLAKRALASSGTQLIAVLKSNAYGHSASLVASLIQDYVDIIAVVSTREAIELRLSGYTGRLLVLSLIETSYLERVIQENIELPIHSIESAVAICESAAKLNITATAHIIQETGGSRLGVSEQDRERVAQLITDSPHIRVAGLYTWMANAESVGHPMNTDQRDRLQAAQRWWKRSLHTENISLHMACSAAIFSDASTHMDMARMGISLYGYWSGDYVRESSKQQGVLEDLRPVLSWKTRIMHTHSNLPVGASISYDSTHRLSRVSDVAVLPVGYADGYDRLSSNRGYVLAQGTKCPILGRVCMNMMMIDVTDLPRSVEIGDEVVLIGTQLSSTISASDLASWTNTIEYEVLTRINASIDRVAVE